MIKRLWIALLFFPLLLPAASTLDIYWIDVEGGAATLLVTQAGETVLMDAGWAGFGDRDAKRIEQVLKNEAKAYQIDYFITSHFHADHVGGLPALAKRVPIGEIRRARREHRAGRLARQTTLGRLCAGGRRQTHAGRARRQASPQGR